MALVHIATELMAALDDASTSVVIMERSLRSNMVFAVANLEGGELELYRYAHAKLLQHALRGAFATSIYLRVPHAALLSRAATRARDSEDALTIDYLRTLENLHDDVFAAQDTTNIVIDGTLPPAEVFEAVSEAVNTQPIRNDERGPP